MISDSISRRILSIRWLGIVFVVLCHSVQVPLFDANEFDFFHCMNFNLGKPYLFFYSFFIYGVCCGAVSVFFLISGYLQFSSSQTNYLKILKKRAMNLLVPYLTWTLIIFAGAYFTFPFFKPYSKLCFWGDELSFQNLLSAIIGNYRSAWISGTHYPFVYQFWFIRDLFVITIFLPVFKFLVEKHSTYLLSFSALIFLFGYRPVIIGADALLYFSLGAVFANKKIDFFQIIDKYVSWGFVIVYSVFISLITYCLKCKTNAESNCFVQLSAALLLLKLANEIVKKEKLFKFFNYMSTQSFFLYCFHGHWLIDMLMVVFSLILPVDTSLGIITAIILLFISDLLVSTLIGIFLQRRMPKLFAILTGFRT